MNKKITAFKAAFPHTLPVFTGFIFLGSAYGVLMNNKGVPIIWIFLMSSIVFAGSAQYMAVTFFTSAFNPISAFFMTLMINARHIFYGISLFKKYENTGKFKPFLIFGMCDETFSITCSATPPAEVDKNLFLFFITFLNYSYWIIGSIFGSLLSSILKFNTKGLDFVLTALFVVIFTSQWKSQNNHKPAIIGVLSSVVSIFLFGKKQFIIPAMLIIILLLIIFRKKIENKEIIQ